jgi:hypothetical protein
MNHWTEVVVKVVNIFSANAVKHCELRIIERNRKGTRRSNLDDALRRFFFKFFVRDKIFMEKETKLLKNRAVNCGYKRFCFVCRCDRSLDLS